MSKEYIEREAAIELLHYYTDEACSAIVADMEALPAADVAPVRHGQWERIGIRGRKGIPIYPCCSACGMVSAAYRSEWEGLRGAWKFCPNCGARMQTIISTQNRITTNS